MDDARIAAELEQIRGLVALTSEKVDGINERLDRLNGTVSHHRGAITALQVAQARTEGEHEGARRVTAAFSTRDRGFLIAVIGAGTILAALAATAATVLVGILF